MAFDGVLMRALRTELNNKLTGAKVEKITQPQKDEVVLFLHVFDAGQRRGESLKLLLCTNPSYPRIHLTNISRENPVVAPNFCMLLRKHLGGSRLCEVRGQETERVMDFVFAGHNEMREETERHLYIEIMGRASNMILTDGAGKIFDCLHDTDISSTGRVLLPGMTYEMPPKQDKTTPKNTVLDDAFFADDGRADKKLCNTVLGFSPTLSRELVCRVTGQTDTPVCDFTPAQRDALRVLLKETAENIETGNIAPCVVLSDKPVEFCFMPLTQYPAAYECKQYATCSEAVEAFYAEKAGHENRRRLSADLAKLVQTNIARLSRKAEAQRGELEQYEKADIYKRYGDVLTASLYAVKKGDRSVRLMDYYAEEPAEINIDLDARLSPAMNAQRYYKLYKKAQTAKRILAVKIPEALTEIEYLQSVSDALDRCETQSDLAEIRAELSAQGYLKKGQNVRRAATVSKPMLFVSDDGFTIAVGKNNVQNDALTLHTALKTDIWFHTKRYPGSHTVVLADGASVPNRTLTQAAVLAATYSSAAEGQNVEVDYTPVKYIKKPNGAKPGKVIYETYQTAVVSPDRALAERLAKKNRG